MPTYTIRDKNEDEYYDTICSWSELQEFLKDNPHCEKVVTAPAIVSGVQGRSFKTDGGFNEVCQRLQLTSKLTTADKVNKTDTIAQNKVRNVARNIN